MLSNTREQLDREARYLRLAVAQRVAGVIVAAVSETKTDLTPLVESGIPAVLFDRPVNQSTLDTVMLDNRRAGREVAEHLLAQGYRRPACLTGPRGIGSLEDRAQGFEEAVAAAGIPVITSERISLGAEGAGQIVRDLLGRPDPPDSIYVAAAGPTLAAYQAVRESCPAAGFVGQDDAAWMALVSPTVTVVTQPTDEIGATVASLVLQRLGGDRGSARHVVAAPALIVRQSSANAGPPS
jgi:LacI family transcriptional regulator